MTALRTFVPALASVALLCGIANAQEEVFSGPQAGELLPPLSVRNIVGPQAGEEVDPVTAAEGQPLLLIFVHKRERPAFGLANALTKAAVERESAGLKRQLVFLTDDPTATQSWLKQIATYFEKDTPVGISLEGAEGPGAYGLNRNVTMTILVAREGKVTANFALVQPSLPADGPKILKAIWDATGGGEVPEITKFAPQSMRPLIREMAQLHESLRSLIQKDTSAEQVEQAAKTVEDLIAGNQMARAELGQIARRVVDSPKFDEYGTPAAREKLKAWADKYGPPADEPAKDAPTAGAPAVFERGLMMTSVAAMAICVAVVGAAPTPVDFDTQIMPILTQGGCNAGACHGAAAGRGGLHLSLYGSDPAADFAALTQQWEGRRINTARPERSLVLRKPLMDLDHGGDQRFDADSESARLLLRWIREGARRHQQRRLESIAVSPAAAVASQPDERITLSVEATFDDQTRRDVTRWAVVTPEDPASLRTTGEQTLEVLRPGRHLALVRYLDRIEAVHVVLPYADEVSPPGPEARQNEIDDFILSQMQSLGLECSPQADGATFLRRASLDLTGRLPAPERVRSFLSDTSATKHSNLIDELLDSAEFVDYWTFELGKLLRLRPIGNDATAARVYRDWIREQLQSRQPYDGIARTLLTATGDSHEIAAANFHRVVPGPREQAEFVSELFLGVRLRCANCHDHPLDVWTQDDYHGLAAIFAGLERGQIVRDRQRGEVTHPGTQDAALPRLPGTAFLSTADDTRTRLAEWLTADDNPYFTRAVVNRLWKHLMGRGLVEPVDDLRATNPGTHPELLQWLAEDFAQHGYDLRHTLRRISGSAAYQRSSRPTAVNAIDDRYYSRYLPTRLEAEVLADAVADVTAVPFVYGDHPTGTRAISLIDPKTPAPALDVLGRCGRDGSCDETTGAAGVSVKLHLLNGPFLNASIADKNGRLQQLLTAEADDLDIIGEFYLRTFSRLPHDDERTYWQAEFAGTAEDRQQVAEDFLWSLLTSREFTTNH